MPAKRCSLEKIARLLSVRRSHKADTTPSAGARLRTSSHVAPAELERESDAAGPELGVGAESANRTPNIRRDPYRSVSHSLADF